MSPHEVVSQPLFISMADRCSTLGDRQSAGRQSMRSQGRETRVRVETSQMYSSAGTQFLRRTTRILWDFETVTFHINRQLFLVPCVSDSSEVCLLRLEKIPAFRSCNLGVKENTLSNVLGDGAGFRCCSEFWLLIYFKWIQHQQLSRVAGSQTFVVS